MVYLKTPNLTDRGYFHSKAWILDNAAVWIDPLGVSLAYEVSQPYPHMHFEQLGSFTFTKLRAT